MLSIRRQFLFLSAGASFKLILAMKTILGVMLAVLVGCDPGEPNPSYYGGGGPVTNSSTGTAGTSAEPAPMPDAGTAGAAAAAVVATPPVDAGPPLVLRTLKLENCTDIPVTGIALSTGAPTLTPIDQVPPESCSTRCSSTGDDAQVRECGVFSAMLGAGCYQPSNVPAGCICNVTTAPGRLFVSVSCVDGAPITVELPGATSLTTTCSDSTVIVGGVGRDGCT